MTNEGGAPSSPSTPLALDDALVIPESSGPRPEITIGELVNPNGGPGESIADEGPIAAHATVTGWISFVAPAWTRSVIHQPGSDVEFYVPGDTAQQYVGELRLWKAATAQARAELGDRHADRPVGADGARDLCGHVDHRRGSVTPRGWPPGSSFPWRARGARHDAAGDPWFHARSQRPDTTGAGGQRSAVAGAAGARRLTVPRCVRSRGDTRAMRGGHPPRDGRADVLGAGARGCS